MHRAHVFVLLLPTGPAARPACGARADGITAAAACAHAATALWGRPGAVMELWSTCSAKTTSGVPCDTSGMSIPSWHPCSPKRGWGWCLVRCLMRQPGNCEDPEACHRQLQSCRCDCTLQSHQTCTHTQPCTTVHSVTLCAHLRTKRVALPHCGLLWCGGPAALHTLSAAVCCQRSGVCLAMLVACCHGCNMDGVVHTALNGVEQGERHDQNTCHSLHALSASVACHGCSVNQAAPSQKRQPRLFHWQQHGQSAVLRHQQHDNPLQPHTYTTHTHTRHPRHQQLWVSESAEKQMQQAAPRFRAGGCGALLLCARSRSPC